MCRYLWEAYALLLLGLLSSGCTNLSAQHLDNASNSLSVQTGSGISSPVSSPSPGPSPSPMPAPSPSPSPMPAPAPAPNPSPTPSPSPSPSPSPPPISTAPTSNVPAPTGNATTDTANITAAINTCPDGGILVFQSGTYSLASTVTLKSNCTYQGQGTSSTIIMAAQNSFAFATPSSLSNIRINGFKFTVGGIWAVSAGATLTIDHNLFQNISPSQYNPYAIYLNGSPGNSLTYLTTSFTNNTVNNVVCSGYTLFAKQDNGCGTGITAYYVGANSHFDNNLFENIDNDEIDFPKGANSAAAVTAGVTMNGNTFTQGSRNSIEIQDPGFNGFVMSGNTFTNPHNGWDMAVSYAACGSNNSLFENNLFDSTPPNTPVGLPFELCGSGIVVQNNTVKDPPLGMYPGPVSGSLLAILASGTFTLTNNTICGGTAVSSGSPVWNKDGGFYPFSPIISTSNTVEATCP